MLENTNDNISDSDTMTIHLMHENHHLAAAEFQTKWTDSSHGPL